MKWLLWGLGIVVILYLILFIVSFSYLKSDGYS